MNSVKFGLMVREFPFLASVFGEQHLFADSIETITVHRGDKNLLEVTPVHESHDIGEHGDYIKVRQFWLVTKASEIKPLSTSSWRTQVPHGTKYDERVPPIGVQLVVGRGSIEALRDIAYIVEIFGEDWSTWVEEWYVNVYKMEHFDCNLG